MTSRLRWGKSITFFLQCSGFQNCVIVTQLDANRSYNIHILLSLRISIPLLSFHIRYFLHNLQQCTICRFCPPLLTKSSYFTLKGRCPRGFYSIREPFHLWALLKVPKCEIFDRSDFHDFYTIKPFWVGVFGAKIYLLFIWRGTYWF